MEVFGVDFWVSDFPESAGIFWSIDCIEVLTYNVVTSCTSGAVIFFNCWPDI